MLADAGTVHVFPRGTEHGRRKDGVRKRSLKLETLCTGFQSVGVDELQFERNVAADVRRVKLDRKRPFGPAPMAFFQFVPALDQAGRQCRVRTAAVANQAECPLVLAVGSRRFRVADGYITADLPSGAEEQPRSEERRVG